MSHLRVVNRTRGTLLGSRVRVANGVWSRLRGYLGHPEPAEGEGILLTPCNAVHTFGMAYPLDILFLDARGRVIEVVGGLKPWRRTRRVRGARYVLEVRAGTVESTGTDTGDELAWMPPRSPAARHGPVGRKRRATEEGTATQPSGRS